VYQIDGLGVVLKSNIGIFSRKFFWLRVDRNVLALGFTSMFTDISSEMVSSVLPLYLVLYLGLSPLQYGVVDGLYQGVAAILGIAGGVLADRTQRHREVAGIGYALSGLCKLGLFAVGSVWTSIVAVVFVDRLGKGIRTAPRDALIGLSTPPEELATAFGVHRALDTAGAVLGPIVGFSLLALAPGAFDAVFVASFCLALVGFGVLSLFVQNRPALEHASTDRLSSLRVALRRLESPRLRALLIVSVLLGVCTISDGFLYLTMQRQLSFSAGFLPLLYVGTAAVYFVLAIPIGRLADLVGRGRVFVLGYLLLLVVYALLLFPTTGRFELALWLILFGAYYAATDGVLVALASATLPAELQASTLAVLNTASSVAGLVSSIIFGAIWAFWDVRAGVEIFIAVLVVAVAITIVALNRTKSDVRAIRVLPTG
jgi:MFS family permease